MRLPISERFTTVQKKKITYVKVYAVGFYILLFTVIALVILILSKAQPVDLSQDRQATEVSDAPMKSRYMA